MDREGFSEDIRQGCTLCGAATKRPQSEGELEHHPDCIYNKLAAAEERVRELEERAAFIESEVEPWDHGGDPNIYAQAVSLLTERKAYEKSEIAVLIAEQMARVQELEAENADHDRCASAYNSEIVALRDALERIIDQGQNLNCSACLAAYNIAREALGKKDRQAAIDAAKGRMADSSLTVEQHLAWKREDRGES